MILVTQKSAVINQEHIHYILVQIMHRRRSISCQIFLMAFLNLSFGRPLCFFFRPTSFHFLWQFTHTCSIHRSLLGIHYLRNNFSQYLLADRLRKSILVNNLLPCDSGVKFCSLKALFSLL